MAPHANDSTGNATGINLETPAAQVPTSFEVASPNVAYSESSITSKVRESLLQKSIFRTARSLEAPWLFETSQMPSPLVSHVAETNQRTLRTLVTVILYKMC